MLKRMCILKQPVAGALSTLLRRPACGMAEHEVCWYLETLDSANAEPLNDKELQFPELLSLHRLTSVLAAKSIITKDEQLTHESLLEIFRQHVLPRPPRERRSNDKDTNSLKRKLEDCTVSGVKRPVSLEAEFKVSEHGIKTVDNMGTSGLNHKSGAQATKPVKLKRRSYNPLQTELKGGDKSQPNISME